MFLLLSLHPQQKNLQDDPLMDIEALLVCGKNKLTVSTLVSILIRHRARTPRTWTDSLLASDDGPTNWLQHYFCLHQPFWSFFKHYLVQKGGSKSSHHHPTPPHPTKNQIWATAPGTSWKQQNMFWLRVGGRGPDCFVFQALPCLTTVHLYDLDKYMTHCMC